MATPRNTSNMDQADALGFLLHAMDGDPSAPILAQEAQGQREFVDSEVIPAKGASDEELIALGFEFGGPVDGDPLFRHAKLPAGWSKQPAEHSMWSQIVDEHGRERVACFYKAAFYDRSAHLSITSLSGYVRRCSWDAKVPVFDDSWAKPAEVLEIALAAQQYERDEAAKWRNGSWQRVSTEDVERYAADHDKDAAKYEPIIAAAKTAGA